MSENNPHRQGNQNGHAKRPLKPTTAVPTNTVSQTKLQIVHKALKESVRESSDYIDSRIKDADAEENICYPLLIVQAQNRFNIAEIEHDGVLRWPENQEDLESVFNDLKRAQQLRPDLHYAYEWEASLREQIGDAAGQRRALQTLVKNVPKYHLTDLYHAELLLQEDRPAEALEKATRAAKQSPDSHWAHGLIARASRALGEEQAATKADKRFKLLSRSFPKKCDTYTAWKDHSDEADRLGPADRLNRVIFIPEVPHLPKVEVSETLK